MSEEITESFVSVLKVRVEELAANPTMKNLLEVRDTVNYKLREINRTPIRRASPGYRKPDKRYIGVDKVNNRYRVRVNVRGEVIEEYHMTERAAALRYNQIVTKAFPEAVRYGHKKINVISEE